MNKKGGPAAVASMASHCAKNTYSHKKLTFWSHLTVHYIVVIITTVCVADLDVHNETYRYANF